MLSSLIMEFCAHPFIDLENGRRDVARFRDRRFAGRYRLPLLNEPELLDDVPDVAIFHPR